MKALVRALGTRAAQITKAIPARFKAFAGSKWLAVSILAIAALATAIVGYVFFAKANPPFPAAPGNDDAMDHGIVLLVSGPQLGTVTFDVSINVSTGTYMVSAYAANKPSPSAFLVLETDTSSTSAASSGGYVTSVYYKNMLVASGQDGELVDKELPYKASAYEIWGMDYGGYTSYAANSLGVSSANSAAQNSVAGQLAEPTQSISGSLITGDLPPIEAWGNATAYGSDLGSQFMNGRSFTWVDFNKPVGPTGTTQTNWYVPQKAVVDVSVIYGSAGMPALPSSYLIESADPATDNSAELYWTLSAAAPISWTLADLGGQRAASDDLFTAGILLGAAFGFLGAAIEHSLAKKRRVYRKKRA